MNKLGFYTVNNSIFFSKVNAILEANKTLADISWDFNKEEFSKVNWAHEPELSVDALYSMRARQIREEFDYVAIMCSGGADSTNMVYSFLNNGIKVDEVIAGAPLSGLEKWNATKDQSPNNIISETIFAQMPLMKRISEEHPDVKISINDYFDEIVNLESEKWLYEQNSSHWIHFSGTARHSLDKLIHLRKLAEEGKKIAIVYGLDKPVIFRKNTGDIYTVFFDSAVNAPTPHFRDKFPNVQSVLFYYSAELPALMVKQAHEVCRNVFSGSNSYLRNILWDGSKSDEFNADPIRGSSFQRGIVPIIYPSTWTIPLWQAHKSRPGFNGGREMDHWVYSLYGKERFVQMFESDLSSFTKNINSRYFMQGDRTSGFIRYTNLWRIGHESDFIPKNIELSLNHYK